MATHTPWGAAQDSVKIARGITSYSTASHGGIHLSPSRLAQLPEYLRSDGGWYEEDCEWAIVACAFPVEWRAYEATQEWRKGQDDGVEEAKRTMRHWHPELYERFYGVTLAPGESQAKDERKWKADHAAEWQVVSACGDWHKDCPKGMVLVSACIGGRHQNGHYCGPLHQFLVPAAEYDMPGRYGFVVDVTRHQELQAA